LYVLQSPKNHFDFGIKNTAVLKLTQPTQACLVPQY